MAKCRGCEAEIVWIKTINGKNMPCNVEKTTIVTEKGETITGHIPHWATCPKYKNFRDFKVGDVYELCEYIPSRKRFTGRKIKIVITYVLKGFEGLKEGWCMFSFRRVDEIPEFRLDYEEEYHRCVGTMARIHNEREENKSTIITLSKVISEQCKKIADLEQRIEDEYWKRRDSK